MQTAVASGTSAYFVNQSDAQIIETVAYNAANMFVADDADEAFALFSETLVDQWPLSLNKIRMEHLEIQKAYLINSFVLLKDVTEEDTRRWQQLWVTHEGMSEWAIERGVQITVFDMNCVGRHIILAVKFETDDEGKVIDARWPQG